MPSVNRLPFRTLLYRYFFAGWLFDGAPSQRGPLAEFDAQGQQRQRAMWLPTYAMRWFFCACALGLAALAAERAAAAPFAVLLLKGACVACIAYAMSIASRWVRLRKLRP